jgi:rSAM/selenodomain-associated transferase 1
LEAQVLYMALVEDLFYRLKSSELFDQLLFYWPPDSEQIVRKWLGSGFNFFSQVGEELGSRMNNAFQTVFKMGYKRALLIGGDIPDLNRSLVEQGFLELGQHDLVLGPSVDGGYYLIGMKTVCPFLFENIRWGTNSVFSDTKKRIDSRGLSRFELGKKRDIDTFKDIEWLWDRLKNPDEPLIPDDHPNTSVVLKRFFQNRLKED